jgi:hypothetical protein
MAAAVPATAAPQHAPSHHAASHQRGSAHHKTARHHLKHMTVKGLVAAHHGRTMAVFAKTAKVGASTRHNQRFKLTFARSTHARVHMPVGDHIRVAAVGRAHGHHLTILRHNDETVSPAPASLFFGTIDAINGNLLTVSESDRDDGDNEFGDDHGHDGNNDAARMSPADHSPGGPGDGGPGSSGHQITIDDSHAAITVDGSTDTPLAVGDTVAVLGEASHDTVVAAEVFGFSQAPAFLRGDITAINGDTVTIGGDNNHGDKVADDHGGDNDQSATVSLTGVPLVLNGDAGATTSQLMVGDKLIVIGTTDSTTGELTPELAFAFNGNDDNPCGHNGDGQDNGGDGGLDG